MSEPVDRHRSPRIYACGVAKRMATKEKTEKRTKELGNMSRITDFMRSTNDPPKLLSK